MSTRNSAQLRVFPDDEATLRRWSSSGAVGSAVARRARIVLLSGEGWGPTAVAAELGCSKQTAITWRERYRAGGIAGLRDAPRSGRPVTVNPLAVIVATLQAPPARLRARRWSSRLLAAEFAISNVAVANVWRSWGVVPVADGRVRLATEPPFDEPVEAVAGVFAAAQIGAFALLTGDPRGVELPMRGRPRLGGGLDTLDVGDAVADSEPDALVAFLARLDALPSDRLHLFCDPPVPELEKWAGERGVVLHAVPRPLPWQRPLRVASVPAGATPQGAASVSDLRGAVLAHPAGAPLTWLAPRCRN